MTLNAVRSVAATNEDGVYVVECNITDALGETYDAVSIVRPDDHHGLNPTLRKWMSDNPSASIAPYTPPPAPTQDQVRAAMKPLTARQFRLGIVLAGLTPAQVTAAIEAMPAGVEKEKALIEWGYASSFERKHPLIALVGGVLGLSDEQIDALWPQASAL
ncbi:hypothetical protein CN204_04170 [Sinorhizobium meliloti]|nr:hypothetical protein CN204_04170 [Sinorhizobium meliloti]